MKFRDYVVLFLAGLAIFWIASRYQNSPGYMDADYYYLGGRQLASGQGFNDPILWNYLDRPEGVPHPSNAYWMPLASVVAAGGQWMSGQIGFSSARLGFILLAASVSPITAALGFGITSSRNSAIFGGVLALLPMFYLPYMTTTDTFTISLVLGGLFLLLTGGLIRSGTAHPRLSRISPLLLGLLAGLMHLARADGALWLAAGVAAIYLAWRSPGTEGVRPGFISGFAWPLLPLALGYLTLMGPWVIRNLFVFGTPLSPGGLRTLWLTDYNELFRYPADALSFRHLAESGLMEIVRVRLWALGSNLVHTIVVQGQIILFPLAALGLWKYRRDLRVQVGVLVWIATFLAMSLAFPFPGVRGGLFHSGAAIQPLIWAVVPVGLDRLIDLGRRNWGWKPAQARPIFRAGILAILLLTTFAVFQDRVVGGEANPTGWDGPFLRYQAVEEWIRGNGADPHDPVLVNNPAGYYLSSDRPAFAIPDAGLGVSLAVAEEYGAEFLILESNHPHALAGLYLTPTDQPGIHFLGTVEGSHIFRILQEGEGSS